jgi:hypothetical protein
MAAGRKPVSPRGKLFGSDVVFDVLVAANKRGRKSFRAVDLVEELGVVHQTVTNELSKLESLRVLELVADGGSAKEKPYRVLRSNLAKTVLHLPVLIQSELAAGEPADRRPE